MNVPKEMPMTTTPVLDSEATCREVVHAWCGEIAPMLDEGFARYLRAPGLELAMFATAKDLGMSASNVLTLVRIGFIAVTVDRALQRHPRAERLRPELDELVVEGARVMTHARFEEFTKELASAGTTAAIVALALSRRVRGQVPPELKAT